MDGANADSDHSLTWEDFYGSTTDLTPTILGIFNSFLDPALKSAAANSTEKLNAKQNIKRDDVKRKMEPAIFNSPSKDPRLIAGSVKLPGLTNEVPNVLPATPVALDNKKSPKKMSYVSRLKSFSSRKNAPNDVKEDSSEKELKSDGANKDCASRLSDGKENVKVDSDSIKVLSKINSEVMAKVESNRKQWSDKGMNGFDVLSPNVKRMLTSVGEEGCSKNLAQPKKNNFGGPGRYSGRLKQSNIPLMGTTSKITSSADIGSVLDIYDKPSNPSPVSSSLSKINVRTMPVTQSGLLNRVAKDWTPTKQLSTFSPAKINSATTEETSATVYDVPVSTTTIYDVPTGNRKVIESEDSPSASTEDAAAHPKISASTGDLKSVNRAREEENGLNQVIRPLSMSSIASSTSTSSSGAQNKGGANSAYLASIESLDDNSDMDMAYGKNSRMPNGISRDATDGGVVNPVEMLQVLPGRPLSPPRPRYCDPSLSLLQRVCTEIVDTENIYVEDLRQVIEGYLYSWRERGTFATEQLNDLFGNIEEIYHFNKSFSQRLNECNLEAVAIARCFVNHSSGFGIYTEYCTGYPGIMAALSRLLRAPDSAQPFRSQQSTLGHALPLGSYLLKPVQRILKYHLLLQNLVKQYKSHDTEYALHKMTLIAHHINDMKRRHEDAVRVQEIQSLLYGWNGQDLTTFGELCAEGTFRVFGAKAMRHAFLFDKMLLLTKNKEYGMLAYKSHIMCNNLMLVESIQGQPLSFHVIPFDCPRMQVTLQARSIQHKREWTLLLKRVILENYNVVIPSHARQLVMELGQNKTDDDILAEKSNSLMSHSSMRKQLSAPEYLEKRKLERDRRKSFESGLRHRLKKSSNRKIQNATENDESEKEQTQLNQSHYLCPDCIDTSSSNLNLCVDCAKSDDVQMFCDNCHNDSKCSQCKNDFRLSNDNLNESNYVCQKCAKSLLSPNKSDTLNNSSNFSSSEMISSNSLDVCEKCNTTPEKAKLLYDRLNDKQMNRILDMKKTCLKCHQIRENVIMTDNNICNENIVQNGFAKDNAVKRVSKDDMQTLKIPKTNTSRRKSEPGIANMNFDIKDLVLNKSDINKSAINCANCGQNYTCRNCGISLSNKRKYSLTKTDNVYGNKCKCQTYNSELIDVKNKKNSPLIVNMYNSKTVPKKISKIKKNRAKTLRHLALDPSAKFYTDISNDFGSDNILHISESTDSINTLNSQTKYSEDSLNNSNQELKDSIDVPPDIDEETYRILIQKTDSFKKSEIERDKLASQKNDNDATLRDNDSSPCKLDSTEEIDEVFESCDDGQNEKPLEQIISQMLMQNREFQKILKKHQTRNATNRRHQRLLKSNSNPEKILNNMPQNIRPKYGRQTSAVECVSPRISSDLNINNASPEKYVRDEHIYESLVIKPKTNDSPNDVMQDSKEKIEQTTPKSKHIRVSLTESDYVYLCFDGKQHVNAYKIPDDIKSCYEDEVHYAVPNNTPRKVDDKDDDIEIRNGKNDKIEQASDDYYENSSEIWKRISNNTVIENKNFKKDPSKINDYSDTDGESQNPNLPQIWLTRQKEHFSTPREKKSGSLPRSFQLVLNDAEQTPPSPHYNKSAILNKVYLNKEGKVLQTDRPFTIASDHSEISYDDIERFIKVNDNSELKFPQNYNLSQSSCSVFESDNVDELTENISSSTLDIDAEIERCYKNKFESVVNNSFQNNPSHIKCLDYSVSSSMEVINDKTGCETSQEDISAHLHPEHKIYKPNVLSFKSVLNRFKSNKNRSSLECINVEDNSSENTVQRKTSPKSNTKSLLQRLKSMRSDDQDKDHSDTQKNKTDAKSAKAPVTVYVTSPEDSSTNNNAVLSNSFSESATYKPTEQVSKSFTNISPNAKLTKDTNGKAQYMSQSAQFMSTNLSNKTTKSAQELNKLPIYKQGSKHLGARIAQSDYADPKVLMSGSNSDLIKVNVFINKTSLRPDSVLSNSSHFTSSSDGCFTPNTEINKNSSFLYKDKNKKESTIKEIPNFSTQKLNGNENKNGVQNLTKYNIAQSDESFFEKSFDEIENIYSNEIFRDSAIYSDPDDGGYSNDIDIKWTKTVNTVTKPIVTSKIDIVHKVKPVDKIEADKKTSDKINNISSITEEIKINESIVNGKSIDKSYKSETSKIPSGHDNKPTKLAPPVPVKPTINRNVIQTFKQHSIKSTPIPLKNNLIVDIAPEADKSSEAIIESKNAEKSPALLSPKAGIPRPNYQRSTSSNINMKRMSFERCSLDSSAITRRTNSVSLYKTESSRTEEISITKSVQERRKEIENTMSDLKQTQQNRRSFDKSEQLVLNRSFSFKATNTIVKSPIASPTSNSTFFAKAASTKCHIPTRNVINELKTTDADADNESIETSLAQNDDGNENKRGGWVKQVVNRFQ